MTPGLFQRCDSPVMHVSLRDFCRVTTLSRQLQHFTDLLLCLNKPLIICQGVVGVFSLSPSSFFFFLVFTFSIFSSFFTFSIYFSFFTYTLSLLSNIRCLNPKTFPPPIYPPPIQTNKQKNPTKKIIKKGRREGGTTPKHKPNFSNCLW